MTWSCLHRIGWASCFIFPTHSLLRTCLPSIIQYPYHFAHFNYPTQLNYSFLNLQAKQPHCLHTLYRVIRRNQKSKQSSNERGVVHCCGCCCCSVRRIAAVLFFQFNVCVSVCECVCFVCVIVFAVRCAWSLMHLISGTYRTPKTMLHNFPSPG